MIPHSQAFHDAMLAGAPVVMRAWIQRQGRTILGPERMFLSDVTVDLDEFAAQRRVLRAKVADVDGVLRPRFATDALAPFGNEMVLQAGFALSIGPEYVQLGIFRLELAEGTADGFVDLTGYDRSIVIAKALDEQPHVIASGTVLADAISAWIDEKYPGIEFFADAGSYGQTIDATLVYEDGGESGDPWANMTKLALLFGRELFVDYTGAVIMRPVPTQTGDPSAVYKPDEFNMAISATTRLSPGDLRNVVKIVGAGSALTDTIVSTAEVDDPSDPLYAGATGAFGRRPITIRSPAVTSQDQADTAAAATLVTKKGASENISLNLVPIMVHEPGDIVAFTSERQDIAEVLALSRWTLNVALRSSMSVATRLLRPAA